MDAVSADRSDAGFCSPLNLGCDGTQEWCPQTWAGVLAHPLCSSFGDVDDRDDCGPYHVRRIVSKADSQGTTFYYDISSGVLVAVYFGSLATDRDCFGPPGGIGVQCPDWTPTQVCTADMTDGGRVLDGGRDGTRSTDGSSDARSESDRGDAGAVCPALDLAQQCPGGSGAECQPTWSDVLANAYCSGWEIVRDERRECGPYHVRAVYHYWRLEGILPAWFTSTYYYDATGALIAMYGSPTSDEQCLATSTTGIEDDCLPQGSADGSAEGTDVCLLDAGTKG
jgi:hypothetical protein